MRFSSVGRDERSKRRKGGKNEWKEREARKEPEREKSLYNTKKRQGNEHPHRPHPLSPPHTDSTYLSVPRALALAR